MWFHVFFFSSISTVVVRIVVTRRSVKRLRVLRNVGEAMRSTEVEITTMEVRRVDQRRKKYPNGPHPKPQQVGVAFGWNEIISISHTFFVIYSFHQQCFWIKLSKRIIIIELFTEDKCKDVEAESCDDVDMDDVYIGGESRKDENKQQEHPHVQ